MQTTRFSGLAVVLMTSMMFGGTALGQTYATRQFENAAPLIQFPASTYEEGVLRGAADVMRAAGDYNYSTSLAAINAQEAERRQLLNRQLATETYFEMRRINREARAAERGPRATQTQLERISRSNAPRPLDGNQYSPTFGMLSWPDALQGSRFDGERELIDQLIRARGSSAGDDAMVRKLAERMEHTLRQQVREMSPSEYTAAKRFLTGLRVEMERAPAFGSVAAR